MTEKGREKKQERIEQVIELAKQVEEEEQAFVIAGIMVASDKFIDREYAKNVKEWFRMTKIVQLYEEEKQEAVKKG
ncbi:hypothetical protein LQZ18_03070 [Lachnospiraceae bacterium ZAX-1]